MHEKPKPVIGRLCLSRAGRDAGKYYIVTQIVDDRYVLIADGATRKIGKPKKKKLTHLRMTPIVLEEAAQRLESGKQLADGELRNMIKRTGRGPAGDKEE